MTRIRSTLNTFPNHIMKYIFIPKNILSHLNRYQRNFLYGTTAQKRKLHLIKWNKVTRPKSEGGLGIEQLDTTSKPCVVPFP